MRSILVGAMVVTVAVVGSAYAHEPCPHGSDVRWEVGAPAHRINPTGRVIHEDHPSAGADLGFAAAASVLNVVYTPVRMAFGVVGAGLGGFSGWVSGGDLRTARGWWHTTTEGDYYIRPTHMDGHTRFRIIGAVPPAPPPETFDEPLPAWATEPNGVVVPEDEPL